MSNPIKSVGMFHTPKDMGELEDWLSRLSGSERVVATTAAMMAWNLASKLVKGRFERAESDDS